MFGPDHAPEDVGEIARKLRERAGLPREATVVVAEGNGARKAPRRKAKPRSRSNTAAKR